MNFLLISRFGYSHTPLIFIFFYRFFIDYFAVAAFDNFVFFIAIVVFFAEFVVVFVAVFALIAVVAVELGVVVAVIDIVALKEFIVIIAAAGAFIARLIIFGDTNIIFVVVF